MTLRADAFTPLPINTDHLHPVCIRASAGSGKTFQLTNRYLQLIAAGAPIGTILASTFTRLAAGQIRDRILSRLAKAADDDAERKDLAEHLGLASLSRRAVIDLLALLASNLHLLQIRTLDSFFASVVRAFAIELGLPLGVEVIDEHEASQLRREAIRLMLDERKPQDLIDLLRQFTEGESGRSVTSAIEDVVTGLESLYREAPDEAWECVPDVGHRLSRTELIQAIESLHNGPPTKDNRFIKAHASDCANARLWDWETFLSKGLASKIAAGETTYYGKAIDQSLAELYVPLIEHARAEIVGRVREQTLATRELLRLYLTQLELLKAKRRAITFSDLSAAMAAALELGTMDEIGYRLDARLHHLLLDEFQDTSVAQWRALAPIAKEIISNAPPERTFFCVGDVKQSIYGWRAAEPEVLDELPRLLMGPDGASAIRQLELARSYRSSQPVIDVVNRVFDSIRSNAAMSDATEAAAAWHSGFAHYETNMDDLPGYVELRTTRRAKREDDEVGKDIHCKAAADLVAQLHSRRPDLSIAVLARSNDVVARMLFELGPTQRKIPASGRGGGPLVDAPAVNAILDLLTLADHPDDTIAAFNVCAGPLRSMIGLTDFRDERKRRAAAHGIRQRLVHEGYGAVLADWVRTIAASCDPRELRRLMQLVELAGAHDARSTLRTRDFIDLVEETDVADVQPAPVQVMTIHQSKGLEFDIVVLPELESRLAGSKPPNVVLERGTSEGETGPISRICRYMNSETRALVPELDSLFVRQTRRTVRESLSVLYVAMTRAIHGLYMIIDAPAENERTHPKTLSGVLRSALVDHDIQADQVIYSHGDPEWMRRASQPLTTPPVVAIEHAPDHIALRTLDTDESRRHTRGLSAAAASAAHDHASAHSIFHMREPEVFDRGVAIHSLFEQIEWFDDFQPDPTALEQLLQSIMPRRVHSWIEKQVQSFLKMLKHDGVRRCLSCNGIERNRATVYREHRFVRLVDGRVQQGAIDRLVALSDANGVVESATIIDFKSDAVEQGGAETAAELYQSQLDQYRAAASEFLGIDARKITAHVLFVGSGEIVEFQARAKPPAA